MHNRTRFANEMRVAMENALDALSSTDSTRRDHLDAANRAAARARQDTDYAEEQKLVDALADVICEMQREPNMTPPP